MMNRRDPNATSWGKLVQGEVLNISDFIDTYNTNDTRKSYYLHDW